VKKERDERKDKSKPRWARKPKVNIDQLVDEISQIYIEKRGGRVPEGVRMNPASGRGMGRGASAFLCLTIATRIRDMVTSWHI
jgi:hypothetical protein